MRECVWEGSGDEAVSLGETREAVQSSSLGCPFWKRASFLALEQ